MLLLVLQIVLKFLLTTEITQTLDCTSHQGGLSLLPLCLEHSGLHTYMKKDTGVRSPLQHGAVCMHLNSNPTPATQSSLCWMTKDLAIPCLTRPGEYNHPLIHRLILSVAIVPSSRLPPCCGWLSLPICQSTLVCFPWDSIHSLYLPEQKGIQPQVLFEGSQVWVTFMPSSRDK